MPDKLPKLNKTLGKIVKQLREDDETEKDLDKEIPKASGGSFESSYLFKSNLAEGGIKIIKEMTDLKAKRNVAMAQLKEEHISPINIERFLREAQILASLEHANIVPLYEINHDDNGVMYFTMKLLSGETLEHIIKKLRSGDPDYIQKYPQRKLIRILIQICDAIIFAHSKSIIHLDLKPSNIQISDFGEVLILDWGFAKQLDQDHEVQYENQGSPLFNTLTSQMTHLGSVKGTPSYMSPEQTHSEPESLNKLSDIYSLGAILYSMITLERPYGDSSPEDAVIKTREGKPLDFKANKNQLTPINNTIRAIAEKSMQHAPENRYRDVIALQKDLDSYLNDFSTVAASENSYTLLLLFIKRNKRNISIFLTLAIILSSSIYWYSRLQLKEEEFQIEKNKAAIKEKAAIDEIVTGTIEKERVLRETYDFGGALDLYLKLNDVGYNDSKLWHQQAKLHAGEFEFTETLNCLDKSKELDPSLEQDTRFELLYKWSNYYQPITNSRSLTPEEAFRFSLDTIDNDIQLHILWNINTNPNIPLREKLHLFKRNMGLFNNEISLAELNFDFTIVGGKADIDLSNNPKVDRISPLLGLPVRNLNISNTRINIHQLLNFIKNNVAELNISNSNQIFVSNYLANSKYTKLTARNTIFSAFGQLSTAPNLKYLDLEGAQVDESAFSLKDNNVEILNIAFTRFQKLRKLVEFTKLKKLIIDDSMVIEERVRNRIKNTGAEIITKSTK